MKKYLWFRAKRYGWGWTPQTWEGWLTLGVWAIINVWWLVRVDHIQHSGSDTLISTAPVLVATTLLLSAVCYLKGEPPRWRWGGK
jgi:hypothetical protein